MGGDKKPEQLTIMFSVDNMYLATSKTNHFLPNKFKVQDKSHWTG